jgi:hypothetical protein
MERNPNDRARKTAEDAMVIAAIAHRRHYDKHDPEYITPS